MLQNYLKIALRNLWKNKSYALINIAGLSVAFGSAMLLFLTAHFELTYDNFHENKDQIFKVYFKIITPEKTKYVSNMPAPLRPALVADFDSEIKYSTRIMDGGTQIVQGNKTIDEGLNYVDADFFKMFSFKMLKGNPNTALNDLKSIVLNEEIAKKVFGETEPMGKTINLNFNGKIESFTVTGITEKAPENSTIENQMMVRFENNPEYQDSKDRWDSQYHLAYVQLANNVVHENFEKKFKAFSQKFNQNFIDKNGNFNYE